MTLLDQLLRLGVAVIAGGALGLNRKVDGKAAGMRTHALVSLGAALTVLAAELIVGPAQSDQGAVTRAMQGVISGIGFIGAGAILKGSDRRMVRGLTTAASIWVAAALGVASGAGYWQTALLATALGLIVLVGGRSVEHVARRALQPDSSDTERRLPGDRRQNPPTIADTGRLTR
jgi:putative Mg2+ transporter-C (MgtC) family protein